MKAHPFELLTGAICWIWTGDVFGGIAGMVLAGILLILLRRIFNIPRDEEEEGFKF